jgi:hypothetical protein
MLPRIVPSAPWIQKAHPGCAAREPPTLPIDAAEPSRYWVWIHAPHGCLDCGGWAGERYSSARTLSGCFAASQQRLLACDERAPDQLDAHVGMGGDVDDVDIRMREQLVKRVEDALCEAVRRLRSHVIDADHVDAVLRVRGQMRVADDLPAADDPDPWPVSGWERRAVVDHVKSSTT